MDELLSNLVVASLAVSPAPAINSVLIENNWCTVGYTVMVPDGREALVTSTQGDICRVIARGEGYVTLIPYFLVEPVYPQKFLDRPFGH